MELMSAISTRRSIRRYKNQPVSKDTVTKLLEAAILAPSASNSQPWAFVVVQDSDVLKSYSDRAKTYLLNLMAEQDDPHGYRTSLSNPNFDIFYNTGTLITIYATSIKGKVDCCLAAQNLMLTAHALGLGTCWIGFSQPLLNSSEFKTELGIPTEYIAVAPLIVGYPEISPAKVSRKPPEILVWQEPNRPIGLSE
jgi:nitroreductase